jgi:phage/plasmid-associated DNA primase
MFNHGMTPNNRSESMVSEVRTDNNNVLQWIDDTGKTVDDLIGEPTATVYNEYSEWCQNSGIRPYGKPKFSKKVNERFDLFTEVRWCSFASGSRSMRVFTNQADKGQ